MSQIHKYKCNKRIHRPLSVKVRSLSVKISTVKRFATLHFSSFSPRMVNGECTSCGQKVRFAMFSCSFLRIIRQSIQVLCPVFSRKVFFRDANKVWTSKTSLSVGRQDFVQHGARVISAAKQPEILHVPLVTTNELLSQSPNSIFRTSFFFRETMNSLPGINKLALKGNMNSLLKGTKLAFSGNINSLCRAKLAFSGNIKSVRGNKLAFSGNMNSLMGMETVLREIIDSE